MRAGIRPGQERSTRVDIAPLLDAWSLPAPWQATPLAHGTNNVVQRVETPAGTYVLRVYANHADIDRLRFEHAVLVRLDAAGLPFAVPAPIPTAQGAAYARVATGEGETLATLTALIPGAHPPRDDLEQASAGGDALGLLDLALARLTIDPGEGTSWRFFGDLEHCHPLVPDPPAALAALSLAADARRRLLSRYAWLMERIPDLYGRLPRQLVHEDYAPDNILMQGPRVTGVLDFEFCARDVRAMDLAVALSWWPVERFGSGDEWPIVRAVAGGYARHVALTAPEAEAMPTLFRLRAFTSLIHRLGRHRQGLSPLEAAVWRAHAALERDDWLAANGERLVRAVAEAGAR
jgi:homoserine kinase type II